MKIRFINFIGLVSSKELHLPRSNLFICKLLVGVTLGPDPWKYSLHYNTYYNIWNGIHSIMLNSKRFLHIDHFSMYHCTPFFTSKYSLRFRSYLPVLWMKITKLYFIFYHFKNTFKNRQSLSLIGRDSKAKKNCYITF